jgi:hypothetical protein
MLVDKDEIYREFFEHKLNSNKKSSNLLNIKDRSISKNSTLKRQFSSGSNLIKIKTVKSKGDLRDSAKKNMNISQSDFNKSKDRIYGNDSLKSNIFIYNPRKRH